MWMIPIVIVVIIILVNSIRIIKEYERGVVLRFGKFHMTKEPGFRLIFPWIDRMTKIPIRIVTMDVQSQEVITKDNVSVKVNAVAYFRVVDPEKAFLEVEEYLQATSQIAQTTLRSVLGQVSLDDVLSNREEINMELQTIVDKLTDPWGVKVTAVEVKDVELTEQLTRAMAREAEAERERRAKVIHADGEFEASQRLSDAASIISKEPAALQLRYLQTLTEISVEKNSTIIFPLPIEVIRPIMDIMDKKNKRE
ncbi:slipin family protein [Candidatus Poribacteria bacterium]|nr:slipin family protein [Candidatus Poribacteria bacterium]